MIMEMLCEKNKQKEARPDNESFPLMTFFDGLRGGKLPFLVMTCMGGDYIYGWARWQGQQRESELPRAQTLCWTQVGIESIEWRGGSICLFDEQGGLTSPNALNSSCFIICHFRPLVNTCGCFCPLNSSQSSTSDESKPSHFNCFITLPSMDLLRNYYNNTQTQIHTPQSMIIYQNYILKYIKYWTNRTHIP